MTLFEKLQAAGLPVISVSESGMITMGDMTFVQQKQYSEILLEHFHPTEYQAMLDDIANKAQLKTEYQQTIDQLTTIESTTNPTNAQVIAAVKFLAKTLRLLLKIIAKLVT